MRRFVLRSKIHRVTVTHADMNYEGSITIDAKLLEAADILPFQAVHVWNITCGTRFETYAVKGEPGSGVVCINGAAARLVQPGDLVIVASFVEMDDEEALSNLPKILLVDANNRILQKDAYQVAAAYVGPAAAVR